MIVYRFKPLLLIIALSIIAFLAHKLVFYQLNLNDSTFTYPTTTLYLAFGTASLIILTALLIIGRKGIDNVGYAFMLLTVIKMAAAYFAYKFAIAAEATRLEKNSILVIFLVFLGIETIATIQLLNRKVRL